MSQVVEHHITEHNRSTTSFFVGPQGDLVILSGDGYAAHVSPNSARGQELLKAAKFFNGINRNQDNTGSSSQKPNSSV